MTAFVGNVDSVSRFLHGESLGVGAHAYLITGPDHVGKRTLALHFAALVTCDAPTDAASCGHCASCAAAARGAHPDIHVIERREDKRTILVEQAQEVARVATIRPYQSARKVIVVVDAESFEERAANLLLKTIEEPSADTRIILTAADADRVLPTIRSRCRLVSLRPVPHEEIHAALVGRGTDSDHANLLARLATGCPGWAFGAADDPEILSRRATYLDVLGAALSLRPTARLSIADRLDDPRNLARTRETMAAAFAAWTYWWRDTLVLHAGCRELVANIDRLSEIERCARRLDAAAIVAAINRTTLAVSHLDANVNPRLVLEGLLIDLPYPDGG